MPVTLTKSAPSRKTLTFSEWKAVDEALGIFEGFLSVFGNPDSYKDIVEPGSFAKTLGEAQKARDSRGATYMLPILWQHNPNDPIGGFLDMKETPTGLYVKGQLDLDIEQGRRAYSGLKKGYIAGLSIGYDTIQEEWKSGYRHLKEIRLWEGSTVTFGANELALVTNVKSHTRTKETFSVDRTTVWDPITAKRSLIECAAGDHAKLDQVFLWHSPDHKRVKLPFCKLEKGIPIVNIKGVDIATGLVNGERGGVKIPAADITLVKSKITTLYRKMAEEFEDPTFKAPWQGKSFFDMLAK